MSIFDTVKELLGIKSTMPRKFDVITKEEKPAADKVKSAKSKTKPVTVKPKAVKSSTAVRESQKSLGKMTKLQIDELAQERLGTQLDRRKTKDEMIKAYMAAQKKG